MGEVMSKDEYILQLAELIFVQHVDISTKNSVVGWVDDVNQRVNKALISARYFADRLEFEEGFAPRLKDEDDE